MVEPGLLVDNVGEFYSFCSVGWVLQSHCTFIQLGESSRHGFFRPHYLFQRGSAGPSGD